MKLNTATISAALNQFQVQLADRGFLVSLAIARAVAYRLPIPSSPVDQASSYFQQQYLASAQTMLSEINEQIVLNIDTTTDLIARIWLFRYRVVYDCQNAGVRSFLDALIKTGTRELPPTISELLIKYSSTDTDILDTLTRVVAESLAPATALVVSTEDDSATDDAKANDGDGTQTPAKTDDQTDGQTPAPADEDAKAVELAKDFHETYERLAPDFGYQTREDTREFDPESANGKLMTAVCKEIRSKLKSEGA